MTTRADVIQSSTPAAVSPDPAPSRSQTARLAPPRPVPTLRSIDLFGDANEIEIEHGDSRYRLRKTLLGKLIMTK
jgi:hemin uptake protein HemP